MDLFHDNWSKVTTYLDINAKVDKRNLLVYDELILENSLNF
jgi:hypothetical protein